MNSKTFRELCKLPAGIVLLFSLQAVASTVPPPLPRQDSPATLAVDVVEHLSERIPVDLSFINDDGRPVKLSDYLGTGRPVLLTLAYYRCPMLCDLVLRGLSDSLKRAGWTPGKEFQAITVSIDPKDTPGAAKVKKLNVLRAMSQSQAGDGWAFLVDPTGQSSRQLADAVGFGYQYDKSADQYAHPAVAMVLTPDGRISRYLYGVAYRPLDVKLALVEASHGKVGGFVERVLLTCFRYDPTTRKYGFVVNAVLKGGAGLVLVLVVGSMIQLWRYDLRRQRRLTAAVKRQRGA